MRRRALTFALLAAAFALLVPGSAGGAWVLKGKGFGHGVGMSQYGAYGFAKKGKGHKAILRHYFKGVRIGKTETRAVRVLLTSGVGSIPFTNATKACGKRLNPDRSFSFRIAGSKVALHGGAGKRIKRCGGEGRAAGKGKVRYKGVGTYRGQLIGRNVGGSLYVINKVPLEAYVRGVIPSEVPTSWPAAALRAQAVAARSYALAGRINGNGYELYDDTRSQVYGGRSAEVPSTNRAVKKTRKQVTIAGGDIATAYFFSTSGGKTENSEFVWSSPRSYLKAVKDPYDKASPVHKWRVPMSNAQLNAELAYLGVGKVKRVRVLKTGRSPRIVRAKVVGSRGKAKVSGDSLRYNLGLRSTWVRFKKR